MHNHQRLLQEMQVRELAVMFVDIVGYTSTTANLTREDLHRLHTAFDALCLPVFASSGGRVVKKIGDAFLVTFLTPVSAVRCGAELQAVFQRYNNQSHIRVPLQIRVAIHAGEVVHRHEDIYGDTVNATSRIESAAAGGHVVFSDAVKQTLSSDEFTWVSLGRHRFKGLNKPIAIYRLVTRRDVARVRRVQSVRLFWAILLILLFGTLAVLLVRFLLLNPDAILPYL
jgi:adenylate cyclase